MESGDAPLSVAEVAAQAGNYTYNAQIPLANWLRTASTMQKEAQVYEAEGNDAQTYLLLYRHADLVLQKLQTHPDRTNPINRKALNAATALVNSDLRKMEQISPRINSKHDEYQERKIKQIEALELPEVRRAKRLAQECNQLAVQDRKSRRILDDQWPALDARAQENHSLAARLVQREVWKRGAARRKVWQYGVSEDEEHERRGGESRDSWQEDLVSHGSRSNDLSNQLQEVARLQKSNQETCYSLYREPQPISVYRYPSIPAKSGLDRLSGSPPARPPKEELCRSSGPSLPPPLPPKSPTSPRDLSCENPRPPPIPGKFVNQVPPIPNKVTDARPPTSSSELDEFTFKPTAYLENGDPLRPVFLPSQLRGIFLKAASSNTRLNLETCGVLCGILKSNALFITRLVVPEQTSTSDTCETLNEGELFDYCDKEELMVLGWIHTHPTQTCFMSSRDLHTHVGYQVMMPESIAIVCAPTKMPDWGCFRLTDPPGKQAILSCNEPGIFHPHDVDNIYTESLKPGHVVELTNAPLELVDMRPSE